MNRVIMMATLNGIVSQLSLPSTLYYHIRHAVKNKHGNYPRLCGAVANVATAEQESHLHPSCNLQEKLHLGIELTHNFGDLAAQKLPLGDSQWPKSCISHI